MIMQNPALEMGDILRAWVPYDDKPNIAGPKFRPVIFWAKQLSTASKIGSLPTVRLKCTPARNRKREPTSSYVA